MAHLSKRASSIKPSPTLSLTAKAKAMRASGVDVVSLAAGEPDFDTPKHIKKFAIKAIKDGFTKYTPVDGTPELKNAIREKFIRDNGLEYRLEEIIVNVGGKHSFYNLAQAFIDPGDEVVIPAPYWVSYPDMVALAEGVPVFVDTQEENGLKMTPEELEAAITPKTKLVVINSPSNPTGSVYNKSELAALGKVLLAHPHVYVVSDDIYETIVFDGRKFHTIAQVVPELQERTFTLNGVSKAYSMTGWRIGYAAGPAAVIKGMSKIQSQSTSNPTSIAQKAAQAALSGSQKCIEPMLAAFSDRRDFVHQQLNAIPGITCLKPAGAFYAYPNVAGLIGKKTAEGKVLANDAELAEFLLESQGIAAVPGVAFGKEPYLRISFATSMANLEVAMNRLARAVELLVD